MSIFERGGRNPDIVDSASWAYGSESGRLVEDTSIVVYAMLKTLLTNEKFDKITFIQNLETYKTKFNDISTDDIAENFMTTGKLMSEVIDSLSETENILYKLDTEDIK